MNTWQIGKVLVLIFGVGSLPFLAFFVYQSLQLQFYSIERTAVVVNILEEDGLKRIQYEYPMDTENVIDTARFAAADWDYEVGDTIGIVVSEKHPRWVAINNLHDIWALTAVFSVALMGSVFFYGLFCYFDRRERKEREGLRK